jgi:hypothetical protein
MVLRPTNELVKYSLLFRILLCSAIYVPYTRVPAVYSFGTLESTNCWWHRVQYDGKKPNVKEQLLAQNMYYKKDGY